MTCDHFEAVMTALFVVDRKKAVEADGSCDPWSIWWVTWKFEDHRLKWTSDAKSGTEPGAGETGCDLLAARANGDDIPVGVVVPRGGGGGPSRGLQ